jgi:hypothetical protein
LAHVAGVASHENEIKDPAAGTEASGHTVRGVMIEVVFLHVTEIGIFEIVEVRSVVDPLFCDIGLESCGQNNGRREGRKKKNAQGDEDKEKRQQILNAATHVVAVKGPFVMTKMQRVEILVCQARPDSFVSPLRYFPMPVQDKAMRKVFRSHPKHYAERHKSEGPEKMMRANRQHQQDY